MDTLINKNSWEWAIV